MTFEELIDAVRACRARIVDRQQRSLDEAETSLLLADELRYDEGLIELARMLDIPIPQARPSGGGLYLDHRRSLEDRLFEAGVDLS